MIVDDDPDWIGAMKLFLKNVEGMEIAAEAASAAKAEDMLNSVPLDVILMDIRLAGEDRDGVSLAAELLLKYHVKIIMLTSSNESGHILDSFAAGAVNYVCKTNYREIPDAVRAAFNANSPSDVLLKDYARLREKELMGNLTPMEQEIIRLLDEGHTHSQIQKMLFKSESTLKNQINSILKKLDVRSAREALRKIKTKGIL